MTVLAASAVLSAIAILSFLSSATAAKAVLPCAIAAAGIGALGSSGVAAQLHGGLAAWAFLFGCGSCGCGLNAARNLFFQPVRWIHRFTIYSGYGAVFAAMGAVTLGFEIHAVSVRVAATVLIVAYAIGSGCIFVAKTLIVRQALKTMPEYRASPVADGDQDYW